MRHEVIVGVERRRVWSDDEKLSILSEVGVHGATVADVARRHDVTRQHIYQWRRQMRDKGLWPTTERAVFLALDAPVASEPALQSPPTEAEIEVAFENGRVLRYRGGTSDEDFLRLIRLVETT